MFDDLDEIHKLRATRRRVWSVLAARCRHSKLPPLLIFFFFFFFFFVFFLLFFIFFFLFLPRRVFSLFSLLCPSSLAPSLRRSRASRSLAKKPVRTNSSLCRTRFWVHTRPRSFVSRRSSFTLLLRYISVLSDPELARSSARARAPPHHYTSARRSARIYFRRVRHVLLRLVPRDMQPSLTLALPRLITDSPNTRPRRTR